MFTLIFDRLDLFIFVVIRMTGFIVFNPIFGRRNIPAMTKAAITVVLSVAVMVPMDDLTGIDLSNIIVMMFMLTKEFLLGFILGLIMNIYFSVVSISGEIMDMQMGLGMSKMYDPGSNIQMPLIGSFYNIILMLVFFMTNSHLNLLQIMAYSFKIFPVNSISINPAIGIYLLEIFKHIFILSIKLAFPIIASELITETGVGIVMRAVPQINVFIVGVQIKILLAILVLMVICPMTVWFFDNMLAEMGQVVTESFYKLAGT